LSAVGGVANVGAVCALAELLHAKDATAAAQKARVRPDKIVFMGSSSPKKRGGFPQSLDETRDQ
jgi:hypothetical protein